MHSPSFVENIIIFKFNTPNPHKWIIKIVSNDDKNYNFDIINEIQQI